VTALPPSQPGDGGDRPPVGGSWAVLYAGVIGNLVLLVALLWGLSRAFR
jgi:hypothetical protein